MNIIVDSVLRVNYPMNIIVDSVLRVNYPMNIIVDSVLRVNYPMNIIVDSVLYVTGMQVGSSMLNARNNSLIKLKNKYKCM